MKVLLNSGGMDSFLVAYFYPVEASVYVNVGHKYHDKELQAANLIANHFKHRLFHMKGADIGRFEHESGIIPFRNAELILNAAQHGDDICLGVLKDEVNSDKSPEFFEAMENVLNISHRGQYWTEGRAFRIETPLDRGSKAEWIKLLWGLCEKDKNHPTWRGLLTTVSCYDGHYQHCGACPSCFKRWVALTVGTGEDASEHFRFHPADYHLLEYWEGKGYTGERIEEIRAAYALRR